LNEVASETFYEDAEYYVWHGMRTLAVDGTRLVLPNHPSIIEDFEQLYHYRWNEEEAYKLLKSLIVFYVFTDFHKG